MQDGSTTLHKASKNGHQSICQLLLTRGADIDTKDNVSTLDDHRAISSQCDINIVKQPSDMKSRTTKIFVTDYASNISLF
jgi:ankyrin repeat protein